MRKYFSVAFLLICFILIFSSAGFAAGPASVYKITITKMELYNGTSWVTVFSATSTTIDIASVDSGQVAGNFVSGLTVPDGTYTQVRTTVSTTFSISGNDGESTLRYTNGNDGSTCCEASTDANDEAECAITVNSVTPDTSTFTTPITVTEGVPSHKVRVSFDTSAAIENQSNELCPAAPVVTVTAIAL